MKLQKIVFETNSEEIHLTIAHAHALYDQLKELFDNKTYLPSAPIYINRDKWARPRYPYLYTTPFGEPAVSMSSNNVTMSLIGDKE